MKGSLNGHPLHSRGRNQDTYQTAHKRDNMKLEEEFFPYVTRGYTAEDYKANIRARAAAYAGISRGIWSWRTDGAGYHCKTFRAYLMREIYMWKWSGFGLGNVGCSENI